MNEKYIKMSGRSFPEQEDADGRGKEGEKTSQLMVDLSEHLLQRTIVVGSKDVHHIL